MKLTWKITNILEKEEIGDAKKVKQTFILEETGKEYPNSLAIDVWGDKTMQLAAYKVWDSLTAELNSRSREYKGRYFNSISAWKLDKVTEETTEEMPF